MVFSLQVIGNSFILIAMHQTVITGLGRYLPEKRLTNRELEQRVETSDEWIFSRTGIRERRIAEQHETASHMGAQAAREASTKADVKVDDIELILTATMTPDYLSPSTAVFIQAELGASQAAACDVGAACSGFLYLLSMAKAYIESGLYKTILLVMTEKMSSVIDYTDRNTCILFGDGAAAAVVQADRSGWKVGKTVLGADGTQAKLLYVPIGSTLKMEGREVFKHAVRRMSANAKECLEGRPVDFLVPHQANLRILHATAEAIGLPFERIFVTIDRYGNTSASSAPIALYEMEQAHPEAQRVLVTAVGAGLTWGASYLEKVKC